MASDATDTVTIRDVIIHVVMTTSAFLFSFFTRDLINTWLTMLSQRDERTELEVTYLLIRYKLAVTLISLVTMIVMSTVFSALL